jgi:hypothetical protein
MGQAHRKAWSTRVVEQLTSVPPQKQKVVTMPFGFRIEANGVIVSKGIIKNRG